MMRNETISTQVPGTPALDYEALVDRFYEQLYRFAFGLAGNPSDAADLTQETYRILLLKGDQVRDTGKIKSWLFTTLYREFLKRKRHLRKFPKLNIEDAEHELPGVEPASIESLDGANVLAALQTLDDRYRAPLAMFYLQQLSYKEIARVLNVPIGTVMSRLSRGKELLRRALTPSYPPASEPARPVKTRRPARFTSSLRLPLPALGAAA